MVRKLTPRTQKAPKKTPARYWSKEVMEKSNALDLESGVFTATLNLYISTHPRGK